MKYVVILISALCLSACSTFGSMFDRIITKPIEVTKPPLVVQQPTPVNQEEMIFYVITRENFEEKMAEIEMQNGEVALYALTVNGYRNLSINVAELRRYIEQQNAIIDAYKEYYIEEKSDE